MGKLLGQGERLALWHERGTRPRRPRVLHAGTAVLPGLRVKTRGDATPRQGWGLSARSHRAAPPHEPRLLQGHLLRLSSAPGAARLGWGHGRWSVLLLW